VVTMPFSCREGINIFLDGYVPTENLRFRQVSLSFKVSEQAVEEEISHMKQCVGHSPRPLLPTSTRAPSPSMH
jgi:translation initiation factor RLI1